MIYQVIYDRNRFPKQPRLPDGRLGCRGCGGELPKRRSAWCSKACCEKWHPAFVRSNVQKRDKGICQMCGVDLKQAEAQWWKKKPNHEKGYVWQEHDQWMRQRPIANYDHIIPFSEGGMTILENMRTLCEECHKKRTREWHKERSRKADATLTLALA